MFSKKSAPAAARQAPSSVAAPRSNGHPTFSVFGADLVVTGNVTASADLHIDGRIEGDITCASLVQGESSHVEGAIRAQSARLSGHVHGSIDVSELVILKTARITGDVAYDALTIEQGAEVNGKFAPRGHAAAPVAADAHADDEGGTRLTLAS
ncbi:MAG: polymer-forming cytoskeletal protein [Sphingomonadales bacterium]|nr:polymer-forming cytoskeletal protein [Sphingomonadales bacterium]MDE2569820.1 polymer-forming cytoskeletal protein [Sphingomonadales bacterium]